MALPVQAAPATAPIRHDDDALPFDVDRVRADFPILHQQVGDNKLVYLDNAATTQKPQSVIDYLNRYYALQNSNIHRGVYRMSEIATEAYEGARTKVQRFLNAEDSREIIFTRGTTEGVNLVAQTFGKMNVHEGDEILVTELDHHSNIVPWHLLCREKRARLRAVPVSESGEVILEEYEKRLTPKTKLVALPHVSNALGTVVPIKHMISLAHERGIPVFVDGAQGAPHMRVDVQDLDCDFYAFSGHKLFGPTGIGCLYGKYEHLNAMPPYQGGGSMIQKVTFDEITYADPPTRFEAGTPDISGAIGLGVAIDYLLALDLDGAFAHEDDVLDYMHAELANVPGLRIIGTSPDKVGVVSFVMDGAHPHDVGTILDQANIAIRTGHHCAQPVMAFYDIPATARASIAFYNTKEEVDRLVAGLLKVNDLFR